MKENIILLKKELLASPSWSIKEDLLLIGYINMKGKSDWEKCSKIFKNKTAKMCYNRFKSLQQIYLKNKRRNKKIITRECFEKVKQRLKYNILMRFYEKKINNMLKDESLNFLKEEYNNFGD